MKNNGFKGEMTTCCYLFTEIIFGGCRAEGIMASLTLVIHCLLQVINNIQNDYSV
jgi:hypothetical protein